MYAQGKIHKQIALISTETTPGRLIGQSGNFVSKKNMLFEKFKFSAYNGIRMWQKYRNTSLLYWQNC